MEENKKRANKNEWKEACFAEAKCTSNCYQWLNNMKANQILAVAEKTGRRARAIDVSAWIFINKKSFIHKIIISNFMAYIVRAD